MNGLDLERIGRVEAYLLRHRTLYTDSTEGHRVNGTERDVARQMQQLTPNEYDALSQLLAAKGFTLRQEDQTFPGIPRGARVWMAVRAPAYDGPQVLTLARAWKAVALTTAEPKAETVYWFTFLWFLAMSFFYDRSGRAVSEVSRYIEGNFTRQDLQKKVEAHLEDLLNAGQGQESHDVVAQALLRNSGAEKTTTSANIRRRARRFLQVMVETAMLDKITDAEGEETYRQSLLCAVQINELFAQDLMAFLPDSRLEKERALAPEIGAFVHADMPKHDDSGDAEEADDGPD